MKRTQDRAVQYQLQMDEEGILLASATILEQRLQRQGQIHSPDQAGDYLIARCAHLTHEVFGVVFLDNQHHISATKHLFSGTVDGCEVHSRVVAKRALELNAVAVILFHNHPSGNPEPSEADRKVTERLQQALELLDIRVLDHLVIGGRKSVSLASRGGRDPCHCILGQVSGWNGAVLHKHGISVKFWVNEASGNGKMSCRAWNP